MMSKSCKRIGVMVLFALFAVFAAAALIAAAGRTQVRAANVGKRILADYETLDGIASTEPSYPSGIMIEASGYEWINPIFDSDSVKKNWESAYYVMFYADNKLGVENPVGITLNSGGRQWTPTLGAENLMYYDDMQGNVVSSPIVDVYGGRTGIVLPAHFKGYVKLRLRGETGTNEAFVSDPKNFSHPSWDTSDIPFDSTNMWQLNYTGTNVYVDTLTVSFDDDMLQSLTVESARFGRGEPEEISVRGKRVIAEYMEGDALSSEGALSNNMLRLEAEEFYGNNFATYAAKDWSRAKYFMFYVDNQYDEAMGVGLQIVQTISKNMNSARTAYLEDSSKQVQQVSTAAVGNGYVGVKVPAGFRGYVKIPFDTEHFSGIDVELPLSTVRFYAPMSSWEDEKAVYIDSLILSFDDDAAQPFDGELLNRPRTDFTNDDTPNDFWVIPNYIEQSYQNAYFDGNRAIHPANISAKPGSVVDTGEVTYNEEVSEMTVRHTSAAAGVSMWGYDYCLRLGQEDWTDAKFVVNQVRNETDNVDKYVLMLAASNTTMSTGAVYYLVDTATNTLRTAVSSAGGEIVVPGSFDGYVVIPVYSFSAGFDWSNMTRFSFMFTATAGTLTFGKLGCAYSAKILFPETYALNVVDTSNYFVMPQPQPLPSYPDRNFNEPEAIDSSEPQTPQSAGCGSAISGTGALLAGLALTGCFVFAIRKKREKGSAEAQKSRNFDGV